jgi:hypothetical protein
MTTGFNPFEGFKDEEAFDTDGTRRELLGDAKRGFVRVRKDFVQRTEEPRPSTLAEFVRGKKERALDLLLTILALEPILEGSPLPLATWATLLDSSEHPCTPRAAGTALRVLTEMGLIEVSGSKVLPIIGLTSDSGRVVKPAQDAAATPGRGFFTIPFTFWTAGAIDHLRLPGKAMLLIMLKETHDPNGKQTFTMPVQRAADWYGISERTAERGYLELAKKGYILQHVQKVADPRHPAGRREIYHRALMDDYSSQHRENLRLEAFAATTGTK